MTQATSLSPCASLLVAIAINSALAQAPVAERDGIIEEIIVTAQKREQTAQEVPLSLYAKSGHDLRQSGADSVGALGDLAAGVEMVSKNPGRVQMAVRGVTNLASEALLDSTAAIGYYVDETPLSAFQPGDLPDMGLWDVERVEILRGPQGTLFGESSMGGTIRVITRKPDPSEFGGSVEGSYESLSDGGSGYGLRATLNAPLNDDDLAMRINLSKSHRPGHIDIPDLAIEDANDLDQRSLRLALGWSPNDSTELQVSYMDHATDLGKSSWATSRNVFDPQKEEPSGLWAPVLRLSPQENRSRLFNLTIKHDLGWGEFVSATSWFDLEQYSTNEFSWLTAALFGAQGSFYQYSDFPIDSLTQEFRLSSDNGKTSWTTGVFFQKSQRGGGGILETQISAIGFLDIATPEFDVGIDSYALFGEVDYKLGERWAVQAGGRYYSDDSRVVRRQLTDSAIFRHVAGTTNDESASASDFAPSIGLSRTGEQSLFFLRAAKGFRAGGINLNSISAPDEIPLEYAAEELWTYEVGFKNRLWDDRLQLNAYVYFNRWDSIQISQDIDGLLRYTSNAGKAEALGTEVELTVHATENLKIGALLALIDTEMKETVLDSFGGVIVEAGNRIPLTPESKLSLTAEYSWPMTSNLNATAFARWAWRSETHSDMANTPAVENDSYGHVFFRLGVEGKSWAAYLSVDNLFNEEATVFRNWFEPFPMVLSSYVRPRTVRLQMQRYF